MGRSPASAALHGSGAVQGAPRRSRSGRVRAEGRAVAGVPVYSGRFGARQAERLLWRAAFGPKPGRSEAWQKGLRGAVHSLTRPSGGPGLHGADPTDDDGNPIAPYDAYGHDVLWWLDRMLRSDQPHRRADVADLARLVRNRRRRLAEARREAEGHVAKKRARLVRRPAARGHDRPGDAGLALGHREQQVRAERELRPRDDGAVHAGGQRRVRPEPAAPGPPAPPPPAPAWGRRGGGRGALCPSPLPPPGGPPPPPPP